MKKNCNLFKVTQKILSIAMVILCLFSLAVPMASAASIPTITSVTAKNSESITIKWKKYSGATGYVIYQKKEDGSYKKIKTIKNVKTTSYTKNDLDSATKYSYKIKAYSKKKVNNKTKTTYTGSSKAKSTYTKLDTPSITYIEGATATSIKLKWKEIDEADGYVIYKKTRDGYEKIKTIRSSSTNAYTVKKLQEAKKYGFVVKAYKKIGDKTIYSKLSSVKYSFPAMPVELQNLHCIENHGVGYVDEPMVDSFGNTYSSYFNFHTAPFLCYAAYNLANKYSKLSLEVVVNDGWTHEINATIEVYADGVKIYKMDGINKATGKIYVDLNVENCEVLKIVGYNNTGDSYNDIFSIVNAKVIK